MLKQRVITAMWLLPLMLGMLFYAPQWLWAAFCGLIALTALWEYARMAGLCKTENQPLPRRNLGFRRSCLCGRLDAA